MLTGGDPNYRGQKLSQFCEKTCGGCKQGGKGNTPGVAPEMRDNVAYPYPSDLRKPFEGFKLESPIFLGMVAAATTSKITAAVTASRQRHLT